MAGEMNIVFGGDACFCGSYEKQLHAENAIFDEPTLNFIQKHHHGVINLEAPETNAPAEKPSGIALRNPDGATAYLKDVGFDVFDLANNHLFDHGLRGYSDTIDKIWKAHGYKLGAGRNFEEASDTVTFRDQGLQVQIIAFAHNEGMLASRDEPGVYAEKHLGSVIDQIMSARDRGFKVIVIFHGGEEYTRYPSPPKRELFQTLARSGAHAIIGHHSHTVQGYEKIGNTHCFYSLGNLVFDLEVQQTRPYVNEGLLVSIQITEDDIAFKLFPVKLDTKNGQVTYFEESTFKEEFASLCDFNHYYEQWEREAHRVFFRKNDGLIVTASNTSSNQPINLTGSSLKKIFKYSAYKRLFSILTDSYNRSLLVGAFKYKLSNRQA